jgi:hypothetical protein
LELDRTQQKTIGPREAWSGRIPLRALGHASLDDLSSNPTTIVFVTQLRYRVSELSIMVLTENRWLWNLIEKVSDYVQNGSRRANYLTTASSKPQMDRDIVKSTGLSFQKNYEASENCVHMFYEKMIKDKWATYSTLVYACKVKWN